MHSILQGLIIYVIAFHVWAMIQETFLWTRPLGRKTFGLSREEAEATKTLAANQGFYNGFLAAGLVLSLIVSEPNVATTLQWFVLSCVAVAGIVGGITAQLTILFVQALPAVVALALLAL